MKKLLFVVLAWFAFAASAFAAVNINTATKEELMTLDGIGESKAQAIIDYRTKNGPFKAKDDLGKVNGIGPGILGKIKNDVNLTGKTEVTEKKADKPAAKKAEDKPAKPAKAESKAATPAAPATSATAATPATPATPAKPATSAKPAEKETKK